MNIVEMEKAGVLLHVLGLCGRPSLRHKTGPVLFTRFSSYLSSSLSSHLKNLVEQHAAITKNLSSEVESLSSADHRKLSKTHAELSPIVQLVEQLSNKEKEVEELNSLIADKGELGKLAEQERTELLEEIKDLEMQVTKALIPKDDADENNAILEVRAGTGGREASLFTHEIFNLYQRFASFKKWKFEPLVINKSESEGFKEASASISGVGVFGEMKYEVGVHRVQRVPVTESMGRVHTSTMTVAVLPQPEEVDVVVNPNDLKIDTFRASGAGGQHVNMTDSAVRITHVPSGIIVSMQEERSQIKNKARAMQVLRARLYDIQRRQAQSERAEARRQQIGTGQRSEKIRTYNYPQDRVTDHRLGETVHGVEVFMQGGDALQNMVRRLRAQHEAQALDELTRQFTHKEHR